MKNDRKYRSWLLLIMFIFTAPSIAYSLSSAGLEPDYTVAKDGSGDFSSIQSAVDASKAFPQERVVILIKNGVYKEKVKVHSWNTKKTFKGESTEGTVITYDDYFDKIDRGRNSTFHTYTLLVEGNDFIAKNLTIQNSAGPVGQAVALHVEADRSLFYGCRILGNQDTIYAAGEGAKQFFKDCYIEGTTDFVFGEATAVFEDCILHSKSNSYITAASTPKGIEYGLVIMNSTLTADPGVDQVYLGRPWRDYAQTVILNTEMGEHIVSNGWHNWNRPEAERNTYYAEYQNTGPGYKPDQRVTWASQLTKDEAENYTLNAIFDDWDPHGYIDIK